MSVRCYRTRRCCINETHFGHRASSLWPPHWGTHFRTSTLLSTVIMTPAEFTIYKKNTKSGNDTNVELCTHKCIIRIMDRRPFVIKKIMHATHFPVSVLSIGIDRIPASESAMIMICRLQGASTILSLFPCHPHLLFPAFSHSSSSVLHLQS